MNAVMGMPGLFLITLWFLQCFHVQKPKARPGRQQRPAMRAEFGIRYEHVNVSVSHYEIDFIWLEKVVYGHRNGAGMKNAE